MLCYTETKQKSFLLKKSGMILFPVDLVSIIVLILFPADLVSIIVLILFPVDLVSIIVL